MSPNAIVSYDDTPNDHDALTLGGLLAAAGARLTLAYVRHSVQTRDDREQLAEHDAHALLARGAQRLGDEAIPQRVVVSPSTADGLRWLATSEHADLIVFGSEYRTAVGHVSPGRTAQTLLEGGPALAIAPAGYQFVNARVETIGLLSSGDQAAVETARGLASHYGATVTESTHGVDLLVAGSRAEAREGRVMLSSQSQNAIDGSSAPVLVVARGVALDFGALVAA
jgi:nucleotide-binding universal stress UspA family protein